MQYDFIVWAKYIFSVLLGTRSREYNKREIGNLTCKILSL